MNAGRKRRRIAFLLRDLSEGGTERVVLALASYFISANWDVRLILFEARGELLEKVPTGLKVVSLGQSSSLKGKTRGAAQTIRAMARELAETDVDVLISAKEQCNFVALFARAIARVQTKLVLTRHVPIMYDPAGGASPRGIGWLYRLLFPFADAIVGVSDGVAENIRGLVPRWSRHKVHRIYNPVVDSGFYARAECRFERWLGDQRYVFIGVGRLTYQKGFDILLEAFSRIADGSQLLLIVGSGPEEASLRKQAERLGISASVDFAGRFENPLPAIRRADCLVLSSRYEGFGIVLVEALALGTNVISTDCQFGPSEILNEGEFGQLVPPEDPSSLAEAMRNIMNGKGGGAESFDVAPFTGDRAGQHYEALCNSLIEKI